MNTRLALLHDYPFQRLSQLLSGVEPPADKSAIKWSVGEPRHPAPGIVLDAIGANLELLSAYPTTRGLPALREAISSWLVRRFRLNSESIDPEQHVLPVAGTREALFSIAQTVVGDETGRRPVVILPNPFYQIYEGAALLAGAEPYYVNTTAANGYRMDFSTVPKTILDRAALVYVCSPGNPSGAAAQAADYEQLIGLAGKHDFVIAADECYSEIYFDEDNPPIGLLQVANAMGVKNYRRCLVFHSLSKRSNLPGLRSGFVAGDSDLMRAYLKFRTYHGATLSNTVQEASIVAWSDEAHVAENRARYRAKFDAVLAILGPAMGATRPDAGFYLWPQVPTGDENFARGLFAGENVTVLPGSYLSREAQGINPGNSRVRMALVGPLEQCVDGAERIRRYMETIS